MDRARYLTTNKGKRLNAFAYTAGRHLSQSMMRALNMTLDEMMDELKEALKTHDIEIVREHILTVYDNLSLWKDLNKEREGT